MNKFKFEKYITKIDKKRKLHGNFLSSNYSLSVVIPSYGEYEDLGVALYSLALNDEVILKKTIIIIVINSPFIQKNKEYSAINSKLLADLDSNNFQDKFVLNNLNLAWVDASTCGYELDGKGGVGKARKLGMDYSLLYFDWNLSKLIISLDADTSTEKQYLTSIYNYFKLNSDVVGASISFKHQIANNELDESAIRDYEYYLNDYVAKLKNAKSPYAYYTVGSAMAFRAKYYIKAGGMKIHSGGEDFYFMQSLRKIGKIGYITNTSVYPSSRVSERVPFGTGPRIKKIVEGDELKLYNPRTFKLLKNTLSEVRRWIAKGNLEYSVLKKKLNCKSIRFLKDNDFDKIWPYIIDNNLKNDEKLNSIKKKKLLSAFHVWFDAFKTLKFIHYLENEYPDEFSRVKIPKLNA